MNSKPELRARRKQRSAKRLIAQSNRPRAVVFRSNKYISVQIKDESNKVLCSFTDASDKTMKGTKVERAKIVGLEAGKKAKAAGIETIAFDRAGYKYHGRVKALAEGLRESGLQF